jgi:hypothetical protein
VAKLVREGGRHDGRGQDEPTGSRRLIHRRLSVREVIPDGQGRSGFHLAITKTPFPYQV